MYQVFLAKQVSKESKKRGQKFKKTLAEILQELGSNPRSSRSEQLSGELNFIWSYHFSFSAVAFRFAYIIDEKHKRLTVIMVGPRENFYKILKQKIG